MSQPLAAEFAERVLAPALARYRAAERVSRVSDETSLFMHLGMLACWRMVLLLAMDRGESVQATFKREALACFPLHVVRSWALAEPARRYPRWVKPRPRKDEPIDMGFCFATAAEHLIVAARG